MELVIASRNKKKIEEMSRITAGLSIITLSLDDFPGCPEIEEDQDTFEGNARKKALAVAQFTGKTAVADDSGLEVEALNNEPGVYSARYAGVTDKTADAKNNEKLLRELKAAADPQRKGRFVSCIALASPQGIIKTFMGTVNGRIIKEGRGSLGFGYDPLFVPEGHSLSFGEMSGDEKDMLSHRGKALREMASFLERYCSSNR